MKRIYLFIVIIVGLSLNISALTPDEIVEKTEQLMRGDTNYMVMEMTVIQPDWERTTEMKSWQKGKTEGFIRVLSPKKDKGTGYLKLGYNLWMYVPEEDFTMKIPPSMMLESFMGSDFTYDDLVKESSISDDYDALFAGEGEYVIDGDDCYAIKLLPYEDAPVVWGKIKMWIRKSDYVPLRYEYYDDDGEYQLAMKMTDIEWIGDRNFPTKWTMINKQEKGHKTIIVVKEVEFNISIDDSMFTKRNLEDWP
jgi:outer membrane lipoprotein-sorting protein